MVDSKVSMVCVLVGIVGLVVGSIAAIAFATSTEFATGTVSCNPDASPTFATDDNCVENTFVDSNGDVCQIGNLGLFLASFTPECTYGSAYEINQALAPQSNVNTLDFGVLFPAQTNFAGLGEALGFPNFTSCDEYFQDAGIASGLTNLAFQSLNETLDPLRTSTKEQYNNGVQAAFDEVDGYFLNLAELIDGILTEQGLNTSDIALSPNTDVAAQASGLLAPCVPGGNPGTWAVFTDCINTAPFPTSTLLAAARGAALTGLLTVPSNVCGTADADRSSKACINYGAALGTEFQADGQVQEVSDFGYWSYFDSAICGGTCSYITFLQVLAAGLDDGDLKDDVQAFVDILVGYENAALANSDITDFLVSADRAGIEARINAYKNEVLNNATADPIGKALHDSTFSKAATIQNLQNNLREVDAIPENLFEPAEDEVPALRLICLGLEVLEGNCTQYEIIQTSLAALGALPSTPEVDAQIQQLSLVALIMGTCEPNPATQTLTDCLGFWTTQTIPGIGVPVDAAAEGLLGAFYDTDEGSDQAAIVVNATAQCADDELDRAAIANAQAIVPGGIALSIGGLVLASLGLLAAGMNKGRMAKLTVAVGGVVALVGVILLIVALLGVYSAPIYSSIAGGSGDGEDTGPEDNGQAFSTGIGLTYAFVAIGGVLVGSIVTIVGGLLLPSAGVEDVLAAKA